MAADATVIGTAGAGTVGGSWYVPTLAGTAECTITTVIADIGIVAAITVGAIATAFITRAVTAITQRVAVVASAL